MSNFTYESSTTGYVVKVPAGTRLKFNNRITKLYNCIISYREITLKMS